MFSSLGDTVMVSYLGGWHCDSAKVIGENLIICDWVTLHEADTVIVSYLVGWHCDSAKIFWGKITSN